MIVCYRIHIITYYSSLITNFKGVTTYLQNKKKKINSCVHNGQNLPILHMNRSHKSQHIFSWTGAYLTFILIRLPNNFFTVTIFTKRKYMNQSLIFTISCRKYNPIQRCFYMLWYGMVYVYINCPIYQNMMEKYMLPLFVCLGTFFACTK